MLFLASAMLALGFVQIPETKVDVFPEFAPPQVEIQTIALGNSSNEVEQLITVPIEDQLGGIEGLEDMRSKSVAQLSSIRLIFERGTDELRARQLVRSGWPRSPRRCPTWASPPYMMPALSATSRIMKIGLTSDTVNMIDMSTIAYWKIRARLLRVDGVAQVAIWGERLPQRHVQVDPEKLAAARRHPAAGHGRRLGRAGRRPAALLRRRRGRHRRFRRGRRPAAQRPPRAADRRTRAAGQGAGDRARRQGAAAGRHGRGPGRLRVR